MLQLAKKRRVALNGDGPSRFSNQRQVTLKVVSVDQLAGQLAHGQHSRVTQVKGNLNLSPGAHTGRDADSFRRPWADARVAGDEKQNARLQARRSVKADKAIGGRDDVADHG
jgi:hypothetical protein